MSELNTLKHYMKNKDHWEILGELSGSLSRISENLDTIHHSLEGANITQARAELTHNLVEAFIFIEFTKGSLSVLAGEWNTVMEATIAEMLKENEPEDYSDMEF